LIFHVQRQRKSNPGHSPHNNLSCAFSLFCPVSAASKTFFIGLLHPTSFLDNATWVEKSACPRAMTARYFQIPATGITNNPANTRLLVAWLPGFS
jgi:hypothetical protein